jgi:SulP family sulfate permease
MSKFPTRFLLSNLFAGLTTGLVSLVYSISFAALIFSGDLAPFFPRGIAIALIGSCVTAIVTAWRGTFPFAIAGPESNSGIVLALMAGAIAASFPAGTDGGVLYATVRAALVAGTLLTGFSLFLLGRFRLSRWARFIPYPVIGGFLAGTGWLLVRSSFTVMTDVPLAWETLPRLFQGDTLSRWALGGLFALVLLWLMARYRHHLVLPASFIGAILGFHAVRWGISLATGGLEPKDWFFASFSASELRAVWNFPAFSRVDWSVLSHQSGFAIVLPSIATIAIVLNATALEVATANDVDLDRELRANGIANIVSGCYGGMVGYLSCNRSLLNLRAGATGPLAGTIAGLVSAVVLFSDTPFLAYLPKPIFGGLLLFIGLNLLHQWVYLARAKFSSLDYALILLILFTIALWGFLPGIGAGIAIACFLFIVNYGRAPIVRYTSSGAKYQSNVQRSHSRRQLLRERGEGTYILVLNGFIFFGTAHALLADTRERMNTPDLPRLEAVIFDFRLVNGLDSSAILGFVKMKQLAKKFGFSLLFTRVSPDIERKLQQGGLFDKDDPVCLVFDDLDRGVEYCEDKILSGNEPRRGEFSVLKQQLEDVFPDGQLSERLMEYLKYVVLLPGEFLFRQGDSPDGLYFLESGRVTVVLELPDNQTKRLRTYNRGTILGEIGFYGGTPRSASIVADELSHLYYLSAEAFDLLERQEPRMAIAIHKFIVNLLGERLQRREEELADLLQ